MGVTRKSWKTKRGTTVRHYVELDTPAWRKPKLYMTLPSGTTKNQAYGYDEMIRAVYASGHTDLLSALDDGEYPLQDALGAFQKLERNANSLLAEYDAYRRRTQADRIDSQEVIHDWMESLGGAADDRTKQKYRGNVQAYYEWVREREGVDAVTPNHFSAGYLKRYQIHMLGEYAGYMRVKDSKYKPPGYYRAAATSNRHLIGLSSLGSYLKGKGIIQENWAQGEYVKRLKERKNKDAAMSRELWRAFRKAAEEVDRENAEAHELNPYPGLLLWDYLVATGALVRKECLENVTLGHIKRDRVKDRGMVSVAIDGTKTEYRDRMVYIPQSLADRIQAHCQRYGIRSGDFIFACPAHGARRGERTPFSDHLVLKVWNQVMDRLLADEKYEAADRYRPQHLRHTFARFAIEGDRGAGLPGVDIMTLMRLMGHSTITTTQRYLVYVSDSADAYGAWMAGRAAGMPVEGSAGSPEKDAAALIVEAARKAGLDPAVYFQALLSGIDE